MANMFIDVLIGCFIKLNTQSLEYQRQKERLRAMNDEEKIPKSWRIKYVIEIKWNFNNDSIKIGNWTDCVLEDSSITTPVSNELSLGANSFT